MDTLETDQTTWGWIKEWRKDYIFNGKVCPFVAKYDKLPVLMHMLVQMLHLLDLDGLEELLAVRQDQLLALSLIHI